MYGQVLYRDRTFGIDEESEGLGWTKVRWLLIPIFWTKINKIYIPPFSYQSCIHSPGAICLYFAPPPFYIKVPFHFHSSFLLPFSSLFPKIYHFSLLELLFKNTFDDIPHLGGGGRVNALNVRLLCVLSWVILAAFARFFKQGTVSYFYNGSRGWDVQFPTLWNPFDAWILKSHISRMAVLKMGCPVSHTVKPLWRLDTKKSYFSNGGPEAFWDTFANNTWRHI